MKKTIAMSTALILMLGLPLAALDIESGRLELEIESIKLGGTDYLQSSDLLAQVDEFDAGAESDKSIYEYKYKSPKKAFILSLLIPGAGQWYAGSSKLKSILMFAVDAGLWGGHFKLNSDGNDITDEFEAFADLHWIEGDTTGGTSEGDYPNLESESYRNWILTNPQYGTVADTNIAEFSEVLPSTKSQQYYEMIGKYDQFRGGWDDYWAAEWDTTNYLTPNRAKYLDMRDDANSKLDWADRMIIVSIVNHLISAFDAALSANRFNKKQSDDTWSLKAELRHYSVKEDIPVLILTRRF